MSGLLAVAVVVAALCAAAVMACTAVAARRLGRVSVVDTAWGLGFALVAVVTGVLGESQRPGSVVRWIVVGLTVLWGGRLARHLGTRSSGAPEDPRYRELLGDDGMRAAVRKVFVPQGVVLWFVSLPVVCAATVGGSLTPVVVAGVVVFGVGFTFEAVGDAQLAAYKRDPDRAPVMDRGLWAWTRHPNYFGDACVWWGLWLIACSHWPGVLTVLSPAAMTWFLVRVSGVRLTEQTMMQRPGYAAYAARTSVFVPLPPRR